jgi:hypothetical protein
VSVTVISCLYGKTHTRFLREWVTAIEALDPAPSEVILSTDVSRFIPEVNSVCHRMGGGWKYPQAYHLTKALGLVATDWVWIHDIDDLAFPDALEGVDEVEADVFQMGYLRSDGEVHLPSPLVEEGKNRWSLGHVSARRCFVAWADSLTAPSRTGRSGRSSQVRARRSRFPIVRGSTIAAIRRLAASAN